MLKFVIQFLVFLLLLISNKKAKGSWFVPSGIIIGLYALCSLMAIVCLFDDDGYYTQPFSDKYWLPMICFDLLVLFFLLPFRQFNEARIQSVVLPSRSFLDAFSTIVIILSLFSIGFFAGTVRNVMLMENLGQARENMVGGELYFEAGTKATIGSVAAANYVFAIMLYFIYKILGDAKIRCGLLLVSSFSETIQVLAFVGRDGVVFWLFSVAYFYAFFRPFMSKKAGIQFIKKGAIIFGIMLIPFFLITISRFDDTVGTSSSIVSYMGQSFINGPLFFGIENKPLAKGGIFPLYYEITGTPMPASKGGGVMIGDWASWYFSTFIVSLYRGLGLFGLLLVAGVMYLLFVLVTNRIKRTINLGQITFYMLYMQIVGEGIFYFKHATRGGNLFILSSLLLAFFFSIVVNSSKNKTVLVKVRE